MKLVNGLLSAHRRAVVLVAAALVVTSAHGEMISTVANFSSQSVAISENGRYVVFFENGNLYRFDRESETKQLVSQPDSGTAVANGPSGEPLISADGRYVVFISYATNLVSGITYPQGMYNLYRRDFVAGKTEIVSVSANDAAASFHAGGASMSPDGRFIAFSSEATNLVDGVEFPPASGTSIFNVFFRDMSQSHVELLSHDPAGTVASNTAPSGHGGGGAPVMSADGRYVAFSSYSTNYTNGIQYTSGPVNSPSNVFLVDRESGQVALLSSSPDGLNASNGNCGVAGMDATGSKVAFFCASTNVAPGFSYSAVSPLANDPTTTNLFLWDRATGVTTLISHNQSASEAANGEVAFPTMSADGTTIAFLSTATNLDDSVSYAVTPVVGGPPIYNAFVYDVPVDTIAIASSSVDGSTGANADVYPSTLSLSGDGHQLAYSTWATNLVQGDYRPDCAQTSVYLMFIDLDDASSTLFSSDDDCPYYYKPVVAGGGEYFAVATQSGVIAYPDWRKSSQPPAPETPSTPTPSAPSTPSSSGGGGGGGAFDLRSLLFCLLMLGAKTSIRRLQRFCN